MSAKRYLPSVSEPGDMIPLPEMARSGGYVRGEDFDAKCADNDRLRGLLRELHECGAVTNWMRVSDDLRGRVLAAVGAAVQPSAAVDASHE